MSEFIRTQSWFVFALLSAVFAALTNLFGKVGVEGIPSNLATFIRVIIIFFVAGLLVWTRGEWSNPLTLSTRTLVFLVLSGVATGLSWLAYYRALQLAPASIVGPVDKLSVLLVMVLGVIFLRETLSLRQWLGGLLILAGVLLVAAPQKTAQAVPAPEHSAATEPPAAVK